jgi:hypothetical protein
MNDGVCIPVMNIVDLNVQGEEAIVRHKFVYKDNKSQFFMDLSSSKKFNGIVYCMMNSYMYESTPLSSQVWIMKYPENLKQYISDFLHYRKLFLCIYKLIFNM